MQDQYAGDVGDFVKLALLRELCAGKSLGIAWYLTPDERHKNDGRHIDYLSTDKENDWRHLCPETYDFLRDIVRNEQRTVAALEAVKLGGSTKFHNAILSASTDRAAWFQGLKAQLADCDLVFVDPDNGIEPEGFKPTSKKSIKSVTLAEIRALYGPSRPIVIYHHHTRFKGGHDAEIAHLGAKLAKLDIGCVCAVRAKMWSPRVFFIVGAMPEQWEAAERFATRWSPHVTFYAIKGPPDNLGLQPEDPYSNWAETRVQKAADRMAAGEYDYLFKHTKLRRD